MIIISREAKEYKYQKPKESQTNIKETQVKGYQHHWDSTQKINNIFFFFFFFLETSMYQH